MTHVPSALSSSRPKPPRARKAAGGARPLAQLKPSFFSVTFGAGGSTRDRTLDTVLEIQAKATKPHRTCRASA